MMRNIFQLLDKNSAHSKIFKTAGELGESMGYGVYLVGGYVRDLFLKRNNKDIDLMVEGDGIKFAESLSRVLNAGQVVIYEKFKTAFIPYNGIEIEVATSRTETYNPQSRKPEVRSASVEEDLSRRDFTVNAMAVSLAPETYGDMEDPFNGMDDLKEGVLITPLNPDDTFSDDPLRMLRATRFSAQLDFSIASDIYESIMRQKNRLSIISCERITEEIIKTLRSDVPSKGFYYMKETGLLALAFPELDVMSGVEFINGKGHKDVFIHTLQVVDNAAKLSDKMEIRFAALVHDIAKPVTKSFSKTKGWSFHGHDEIGRRMLRKVAKRMKLSNELRDYLMIMTKLHLRPIALAKSEISDSAVRRVMFEAGEFVDDLMILCRADITTKNHQKVKKYISNFDLVEKLMQDVKLRDEMRSFQSPVRGDVIMNDLKLTEGPLVGKIKKAIEEAILDGEIDNDYESAYQFMIKTHKKMTSS